MGGLSAVTLGKHFEPEWDSFSIALGAKDPISVLPVLPSSGCHVNQELAAEVLRWLPHFVNEGEGDLATQARLAGDHFLVSESYVSDSPSVVPYHTR